MVRPACAPDEPELAAWSIHRRCPDRSMRACRALAVVSAKPSMSATPSRVRSLYKGAVTGKWRLLRPVRLTVKACEHAGYVSGGKRGLRGGGGADEFMSWYKDEVWMCSNDDMR